MTLLGHREQQYESFGWKKFKIEDVLDKQIKRDSDIRWRNSHYESISYDTNSFLLTMRSVKDDLPNFFETKVRHNYSNSSSIFSVRNEISRYIKELAWSIINLN